jgi:hypothetical protein
VFELGVFWISSESIVAIEPVKSSLLCSP